MTEIAYIDESYDGESFAMSAVIVPAGDWTLAHDRLKAYRKDLKSRHGILLNVEFHATKFIAGRGQLALPPKVIPKGLRAAIFREYIQYLATIQGLRIISGCWPRGGQSLGKVHTTAFDRIQSRLQRRAAELQSHMIVVVDEGKEEELRKLARVLKETNLIPAGSRRGTWEDGATTKNIPNDRLLEDPFFQKSCDSLFLQAADFVAFALLKSEVAKTKHVEKYNLATVYEELKPILVPEACRHDPRNLGIVRG